ncbi:MAG: hypothetical protein QOC73_261 [Actinomycetota bacterium]|nr:hypothetical protein [Actinomycetota bacterium]
MPGSASSQRRRIALVTTEPLGPAMAGPAIRAVELGRVLATEHEVVVATTAACDGAAPTGLTWRAVDTAGLRAIAAASDVLVLGGDVLAANDWLAGHAQRDADGGAKRAAKRGAEGGAAIVVDLYDPFHLEQLEQARDLGEERRRRVVFDCIDVLNTQAALGDTFLCASDRQRDLWTGHLAACGRVNPATYDADPTLGELLRIVPFGVPDEPPQRLDEPVLRGVVDGIGPDDEILLWGGGIYNWFDPQTLIKAVDVLRSKRPNLRLVFMGARHPNPAVATMRAAVGARELSESLGLTGVHVFFSDTFSSGWVPYADRGRYLAEATIGVSTHHDHIETAFSFRTRVLDYFWAGLPVVTTRGDAMADLVEAAGAGRTVTPGDVDGLAAALHELLDDKALRTNAAQASRQLADSFRWSVVAAPLIEFCRHPYRAPDLADPALRAAIGRRASLAAPATLSGRVRRLRSLAAADGWPAAAKAVARRARPH